MLLEELKDRLAEQYDEVELLELLEINSFQLVQKFSDVIENNYEYFKNKVDDDQPDFNYLEEEGTDE